MSMNFANPTTDFTFKRLFGSDNHKNLTISLLNNILGRKQGNLITQVTFGNIENIPVADGQKESYLDILCKDQLGYYFIIEMQVSKDQAFGKRSLYYSALKLIDQMHDKDLYSKIKPVIFIGILSHPMFANRNRVVSHHLICDMDTGHQSFEELEFHYVELCNFHKTLDELTNDLDKWLFFLKYAQDLQVIPDQFAPSPEFQQAFTVLEQRHWNEQERRAYRKSLDVLHKDMQLQAGIFEEGFEDGFEKGIEKGIEEGVKVVALNLLKNNIDMHVIAQSTGLTIEQIEKLKKS